MGKKDVRLKVCSETFNSIKYLKMSGLQDLLAERVTIMTLEIAKA